MDPGWLVYPGLLIWSAVLFLPWRPWSTRENLDVMDSDAADLSEVTVLIPARNEADHISATLHALAGQGDGLHVILIDDQSRDGTRDRAEQTGLENLKIVNGELLPEGWSGKLWALEQGRRLVTTPVILLLDADIRLLPGTVHTLLAKMKHEKLQLVSLMAHLRMENPWEKLLMPAFIYFFKLLYPFRISNSETRLIAAAAGGCIMVDSKCLEDIGGFSVLRDELIDDCALARHFKNNNCKTWIGLTHSAISDRKYQNLKSIWNMVARTAFTQLHYSLLLLILCTAIMSFAFLFPIAALFSKLTVYILLSLLTFIIMAVTYRPTLKFYGLSPHWALFLPIIGVLYLLMTWCSAVNHWRGRGAEWKERTYTA